MNTSELATPLSTRSINKKRAPPSMGSQIGQPNGKMSVLAVEVLKKPEFATPPSTRSTKKASATEHGNAYVSAQWQNEHSGRGGVEKVGISNATEHEKHKTNDATEHGSANLSAQNKTSILTVEGLKSRN